MGTNFDVNKNILFIIILPNIQCCKTTHDDETNILNNNFEKKQDKNSNQNNKNNNFITKEESISKRRKAIIEEVSEFLNLNNSYEERRKEIQNYLNKKKSYKMLNLVISSTTLNFSKNIYSIAPGGMVTTGGLETGSGDGVVLFGYEPVDNLEQDIEEDNYKQRKTIYDFIFPTDVENSINLNEFPSFAIYFDTKEENYYIRDFNMGIGALMKVKKIKIENNTLINVGANYLVVNIEKEKFIVKIFNTSILENNGQNDKKFIMKEFKILKKDFTLTIGRNKKCDICINDMMMSKIQSTIKYIYQEKNFYLFDGNSQKESMNGTWIYILNPVLITDNFIFKAEHTLFEANLFINK